MKFVGANEHLLLLSRLGGLRRFALQEAGAFASGRFWPRRKIDDSAFLGGRRPHVEEAAESECRHCGNGGRAAPDATMQPDRTSSARPGHHPSSWYSNVSNPVTPPMSGGSPAAASGGSSPALLKSAVTFDNTYSRKPTAIPPKTIFWTPPKRNRRRLTAVASRTIDAR